MHVHVLIYHLVAHEIYYAVKLCHGLKLNADECLLSLLRIQICMRRRHIPPCAIYV